MEILLPAASRLHVPERGRFPCPAWRVICKRPGSAHSFETMLEISMKKLTIALSLACMFASASAWAADYKIMAPAAPGGGWDQTARAMQSALQDEKISSSVQVVNVPGAGGTIGL